MHFSCAYRHLGWNLHPGGGSAGSLISPGKGTGGAASPPILGTAPIEASVYGCKGNCQSSEVALDSTIEPRYMTATLSAMWRTMARSCEIKSMPTSFLVFSATLNTIAC